MRENTSRQSDPVIFEIGCWRFDTAARDLGDGVRSRRLTPKAAAVLAMLAEADGQLVTRAELLDRVWPDADICEEALTHSVAEIRRALGDSKARVMLETVHGTGYRLREPVRVVSGDEPPKALELGTDFDLDAYLDFSEARRLCERDGERALPEAVELCGTAAARAPDYAPILSEHAALIAMRQLYSRSDGHALDYALDLADRAADLRPDLACGHVSRGVVLAALGHKTKACAAFLNAISRDPQDFQAHYHFARALFAFRDLARAGRMAECAASLRPDDYRPLFLAASSWSALGNAERARSVAVTGLARLRIQLASGAAGNRPASALSLFLALLERHEEARRAIAAQESTRDALLYYGVSAYALLGDVNTALDRLEGVVDRGFRHADWLRADPTLEPLRTSPRYKRLMAALDPT